jgi:hypothetical protein
MSDSALEQLNNAALEAYNAGCLDKAEKIYARMVDQARADDNPALLVRSLSYHGCCLALACDYSTALATCIEAVKIGGPTIDLDDRYRAMIRAIAIAVCTRPIDEINRLIAETDQELNRWGRREWRHKLLSEQSDCLSIRGELEHAKSLKWESLRLHDTAKTGSTYLRSGLVAEAGYLCLLTSDHSGMARAEIEMAKTELDTEFCRVFKCNQLIFATRLAHPTDVPPCGPPVLDRLLI